MAAKEDSEVRQKQRREATRTGVTETERIAQRYQRKSCSDKKKQCKFTARKNRDNRSA